MQGSAKPITNRCKSSPTTLEVVVPRISPAHASFKSGSLRSGRVIISPRPREKTFNPSGPPVLHWKSHPDLDFIIGVGIGQRFSQPSGNRFATLSSLSATAVSYNRAMLISDLAAKCSAISKYSRRSDLAKQISCQRLSCPASTHPGTDASGNYLNMLQHRKTLICTTPDLLLLTTIQDTDTQPPAISNLQFLARF